MSLCINPNCNYQNPSNLLFCQHCGSELLLQGRYRATKILGRGGFGQTYEICNRDETKVLKVLINNSSKAVDLFKREAEVLSKINCPGIPKFDSYFSYQIKDSETSLNCLVMEKIEGLNLRQYIEQRGRPIDGSLAQDWLIELLEILEKVHSQGILHRDIKPDNIILDPYGKLFLIDFGAVKEGEVVEGTEIATRTQNVTETKTGTSIHSGGYTAREQIIGQARIESDIYSLGCTFVYLLTAKEPNSKENYDSYNDKIDWQKNASEIPPQLAEVIDTTIAARASDRPKSCQIVLDKFLTERVKENRQANIFAREIKEARAINCKAYSEYKEKYSEKNKSYILGISIGLVDSTAAVYKDSQIIELAKIPSVVAYTDRGECLVGEKAKQQQDYNSANTFNNFLYFIDQSYNFIKKFKIETSYQIAQGKNGEVIFKCPALNEYISPVELLIELIYKVLCKSTERSGLYFNKIVLTLPSFLNNISLNLNFSTREEKISNIQEMTGTELILRIYNESLMYHIASSFNNGHLYSGNRTRTYLTVVVYDFFLEISCSEISDGVIEVLFSERKYFVSGLLNTSEGEKLILEAIDYILHPKRLENSNIDIAVAPTYSSKFSAMKALYDSRVNNRIEEIIWSNNITANGTAMLAGILSGTVKDMLYLPINYSAFGIWTEYGFVEIVPKSTTIPNKESKSFLFKTNSSTITIPIVEKDNEEYQRVIAIINCYDLSLSNGISTIEITFDIDANNILNAVAVDKISGKEYSSSFTVNHLTSQEILVEGIYDKELLGVNLFGREAIWHGHSGDSLIEVTELMGVENGDVYMSIRGSDTGIKLEEIEFSDRPKL